MPQDHASRLWLAGSLSLAVHGSLIVIFIFAPLRKDAEHEGPIPLDAVAIAMGDEPPEILPASIQPPEPLPAAE